MTFVLLAFLFFIIQTYINPPCKNFLKGVSLYLTILFLRPKGDQNAVVHF
jgi:hypothetical protein